MDKQKAGSKSLFGATCCGKLFTLGNQQRNQSVQRPSFFMNRRQTLTTRPMPPTYLDAVISKNKRAWKILEDCSKGNEPFSRTSTIEPPRTKSDPKTPPMRHTSSIRGESDVEKSSANDGQEQIKHFLNGPFPSSYHPLVRHSGVRNRFKAGKSKAMTDDETPRMVRPLPHPPVRLPSSIYKIMEPHSTSSSSKSDAHFYRSRNAKLMRVTKTAMDLESNKTLKASEDSKKIEPTMSSDSTTKCQEFMKMVQRIQELEEKMKKLVQGQHVEQTVVHDQRKSKQQDKVMVVKKEILANLLMDQSEMSLVTASGDQRAKIKRIQLSNVTTQTSKLQLQEKLSRSAACPIPRVPQTELEGLYSESTSSVEKKFRKFYPTEEFSPLETGRSIQELKTQVVEDLGPKQWIPREPTFIDEDATESNSHCLQLSYQTTSQLSSGDVLDATSFSRRTPGGASDVAETDLESEETCGYLKGRCPEDSETEEESYSLLSPLCFRRRASARPKENIPRSTYPIPPPRPNRHY